MKPNHLVTFDATVRLHVAVRADGDTAAYFAAAFNASSALRVHPDIVEPLAQRGLAITRCEPIGLVSVKPLNEETSA